MSANRRKIIIVIGIAVVGLAALGLVSNAVGKASSERAALKIAVEAPKSHWKTPFRFSDRDGDAKFISGHLEAIGESFQVVSAKEFESNPHPHVRVHRAVFVAPFVQRVSTSSRGNRLFGDKAAYSYVVSFFGLPIYVKTCYYHSCG